MANTVYSYYMDGNIHTETDHLAGTAATYTYDKAGRLKTEVSSAGSYSYTYDFSGNRATMTENGTTTTYTYDENNRLLRESKPGSIITYTYDANGNLLTGDGATYTYDARNRQVGYVKGSDFATYTYYPSGLRKTKTTALAISNYIWDGSNMICEYASSATSGKVYTYGHTLISQGTSWYYLYNAHGDVVKYTNANGAVLQSYDYDAFGEEADPSTTDANPFRYAGQYFDDETGTYYLRARYYNPGNGRFSQEDTHWNTGNMLYGDDPLKLGEYLKPSMDAILQSSNLYAYCGNNPVAYIDTSGNIFMLVAGAVGAVLGGIIGAICSCAKHGEIRWQDVAIGVVGGGVGGLTLGAGVAYIAAGSITASTAAVVLGVQLKVAGIVTAGYASFEAFKRVYGSAGPGKAWHHIVEQTTANINRFGAEMIHNVQNIVKIPHGAGQLHNMISGHYSSIQSFTNGMTVRAWLSTQSFEAQLNYGLEILTKYAKQLGVTIEFVK